jgi:hypothetical protein
MKETTQQNRTTYIYNESKHRATGTITSPRNICTCDMKEIQQKIKNCDIKATRQVVICQIPKYLSCCITKGNKRSHKKHRGSITQDDGRPGSNTSIDHVDAANVPIYTWQHKGRPTLKKYKNFMLFVDHKTRLVYPSFQESKTASAACRSKCDYETITNGPKKSAVGPRNSFYKFS